MQIGYWSETNESFILKLVSSLRRTKAKFIIETSNVTSSSETVKLSGASSAACVLLWNLASFISKSLAILTTSDRKTRDEIQKRLKTILRIMNFLKEEGIPSMSANASTDLTVELCAFYHSMYSYHLYELLISIKPASSMNHFAAGSFLNAASKFSSISDKKLNAERQIYYRLRGIELYSAEEEEQLNIGEAIALLNMFLQEYESCSRSFKKTYGEMRDRVKDKHAMLTKDNSLIYFVKVPQAVALPELEVVSAISDSLTFDSIKFFEMKEVDELMKEIEGTTRQISNAADSFSLLVNLAYECDNARKQANAVLFSSGNISQQHITSLKHLESELDTIFNWISLVKTTSLSVFETDATHKKLESLRARVNRELTEFIDELDYDDAQDIVKSVKQELALLSVPKQFETELADKTTKVFELMGQINQ